MKKSLVAFSFCSEQPCQARIAAVPAYKDGARVVVRDCQKDQDDQWVFDRRTSQIRLADAPGFCLKVAEPMDKDDNAVTLWTCASNPTSSEQWVYSDDQLSLHLRRSTRYVLHVEAGVSLSLNGLALMLHEGEKQRVRLGDGLTGNSSDTVFNVVS